MFKLSGTFICLHTVIEQITLLSELHIQMGSLNTCFKKMSNVILVIYFFLAFPKVVDTLQHLILHPESHFAVSLLAFHQTQAVIELSQGI